MQAGPPNPERELLQVVSGSGEFNNALVREFLTKNKLDQSGVDYQIIAITGPQSSGKSTLLNHVVWLLPDSMTGVLPSIHLRINWHIGHLSPCVLQFGTNFEEMDAFKGRGQTTKGIWLARSTRISDPPTLVMDLEGNDGRERGEDDTSFERQSSLFALAIADVLVINIWAKDIGRETGSGKPLLKTVFQVSGGLGCAFFVGGDHVHIKTMLLDFGRCGSSSLNCSCAHHAGQSEAVCTRPKSETDSTALCLS